MAEVFISLYAMVTTFVLLVMQRNRRSQRSGSHIVVLAGSRLFSLSSTLAVLMGALGFALALGFSVPLPAGFDAPLF
jgi:hypothetical protein